MALKSCFGVDCFRCQILYLCPCEQKIHSGKKIHLVAVKFRKMHCLLITSASLRYIHSANVHVQPSPSAWPGLQVSLQRERADWLLSAASPCCWTRAASPRKIWWQHLALSRRVSWFPSRGLVASRWLSLDSQAEHHLFRDCCDANKGGRWGCTVGIARGVEAEMQRRCYSLVRTSSTSSSFLTLWWRTRHGVPVTKGLQWDIVPLFGFFTCKEVFLRNPSILASCSAEEINILDKTIVFKKHQWVA